MRIAYFGSGEFGLPSLRALARTSHDIWAVVTQPARLAGRGKKLQRTPAALCGAELGLKVIECENVNNPDFFQQFRDQGRVELVIVIAFGQKIGNDLLDLPGCRWINLHGSLLPKYRGAAPINWAIINGEKEAGITIIELNSVWDGGNMLGKSATEIGKLQTAGELHDRLSELGPDLICQVVDEIAAGTEKALIQDDSQSCRAPKMSKTDGALDWSRSAVELRNQIHGMWPWPGAFCNLQQADKDKIETVSIARVEALKTADTAIEPGTVTEDLTVACGAGSLRILEIKPQNSRLMPFDAFVNGRHIQPGDKFNNG